MNQEILNFCIGKGILLDKETLNIFENFKNPDLIKRIIEILNFNYNKKFITRSFFNSTIANEILTNSNNISEEDLESLFLDLGVQIVKAPLFLSEYKLNPLNNSNVNDEPVKIIHNYKNNPKKIVVEDFIKNFRNRYNVLKSILQEHSELDNLVSISRLNPGKQSSIIALVYDKRVTKNGNILLDIEDLTGRTVALINKSRTEIYEKSKEILLDEVIALKCSGNGEMVFVNDIIFPDVKLIESKKSDVDEIAAFISDVHIGSMKFLESNFLKFINWINGNLGGF